MRRTLAWGILLATLLSLPVLPPAAAQSVGSSDVLVFPVGSDVQTANLGSTASFAWLLYDNGTAPYLVSIDTVTVTPSDSLSVSVSRWDFFLRPGEFYEVFVNVTVPLVGGEQSYLVEPNVRVINLSTGRQDSVRLSATLNVTGFTAAENPRGKILGTYPNFMPAPLNNEYGAFVVTVLIWLLISSILVFVVDPVVHRITKRTKTRVDDIILNILRWPLFILILVYGAVESLSILGLPPNWYLDLVRIRGFVFILVATWVAYRIFREVMMEYGRLLAARTKSEVDDRLIPVLDKIGAVVIVIVGVIYAVQSLGYDITLFLAGLGVMGLILAFAAQDTLSNFFAGIHLMLDRPFKQGDLIQLESGEICEVREIGLRSTKLYWGRANTVLILPNNKLAGTKIINYERPDQFFRVHVTVGVAYDSDIDKVRRVLLGIIEAHPGVVHDEAHAPAFQVDEFGDSAVMVRVIFWVRSPRDQWRVASEVREAVLKRFREEGIVIPFPQRVVWSPRPSP